MGLLYFIAIPKAIKLILNLKAQTLFLSSAYQS